MVKTPAALVPSGGIQKLNILLANKPELYKSLNKLFFFGAFFQGINAYQTAVNTRQPSLIANAILNDFFTIVGIFHPSKMVFLINSTLGMLYGAGKKTDIENNNHPESIREWNFERLTRFFHQRRSSGSPSLYVEFLDFFRFIGKDLKNAFSPNSWRELKRNYRDSESWKIPQSYQNALSSQCLAASFFMALFGMKSKKPFWSLAASGISFLGSILLRIPIFLRSWQNRGEWDGKLVIMGVPLTIVGGLFQPAFIQAFPSLWGLAAIGNSMISRGVLLNSKSYREEVDLLESLRKQSFANPKLTAAVILKTLHAKPEQMALLKQRIGTHRTGYLIGLLRQAEDAKNRLGIPLTQFLLHPPGPANTFHNVSA